MDLRLVRTGARRSTSAAIARRRRSAPRRRAAGFARAETSIAQHLPARRTLREAELEGRLDKSWTSQLTVLSDAEYDAGVARVRAAARAAEARGGELVLESDLRLFATTAWLT